MTTYTIDAQNKRIGRVATEAASLLIGKNTPDFKKNTTPDVTVEIINASKADITEKKTRTKIYRHYSGYPGGLKEPTLGDVVAKKGFGELFKHAIYGMLPANKLRKIMLGNLIVKE